MSRRLLPSPTATIQVGCTWYDGETLEPGPTIEPVTIPLSQLKGSPFYVQLLADLAKHEAEAMDLAPGDAVAADNGKVTA